MDIRAQGSRMNVVLWIVKGLLAVLFLFAGAQSWSCRPTRWQDRWRCRSGS